jgi:circadian clock protein KaiC
LTYTTPALFGPEAWLSDTSVATFCDALILLRYVACQHALRRELTVLKMRGSWHDTALREYRIDQAGIHIDLATTSDDGLLGLR